MCGIVGFQGLFDESSLEKSAALIAHRGPDDKGIWCSREFGVGLAHRRLSIIDLSPLAHQPMVGGDGSVVLVFNGEIYNFRDLRVDLEATGYRFRSQSDTEVLLALYLRDGFAMLPKLNGVFAFGLWDRRSQELFIARDALGVKPMYFAESPLGVAFASELKALLALSKDTGGIDTVSLHRYLSFLWCPGDGTPVKGIRKLGPGEAVMVREGRITRRWRWYELPAVRMDPVDMGRHQAIHGTESMLRTAVCRQLVSDVPVGAFLSGGLDSSAIVAMAREQVPDIRCFTIDARGGDGEGITNDLPYARRVATHLGVPLEVVHIDSSRMAADLEGMVYQLDEPLADPAPLNVLYISRLASAQGIKVLLSGAGGDDIFSGYRRHLASDVERYWSWLPQGIRRHLDTMSAQLDQRKPAFRRVAKLFSGASLEGDMRLTNHFAWARESQLISMYTREFRESLGHVVAAQPMLDFLATVSGSAPPLERLLALEQKFFLADHNLIYTDKMSMAAGVEVRVPFLDLDLVEFAAAIPSRFKQKGRESKWVLKKAMEPFLPRDVIYRPKTGFGAPLRQWLRNELRDLVNDVLSADTLLRRGLFDPKAVTKLIADDRAGRVDGAYTILALVCIEIWCQRFIDTGMTTRQAA